ncbi:uncharacterized protein [Argopecten irradians]|uniref:uncharacterized protein n=1 Tax=Argopecten irradians TaxID=31199 RepID=UPI003712BCE9
MASSFLGPETPRPLSVATEGYQNRYHIPQLGDSEKYVFGGQYDEKLFTLIHKYLELGTTDRFCYIGDSKGSFAQRIVDKFCLLEPAMSVIPGHYSYLETDTEKVLSIRVAHVGAEEYFRQLAKSRDTNKPQFDKVIIIDAIRYFENPIDVFENIMKCLSKQGKLLIIHRPGNITTLPVFKDAQQRVEENETPYMDIINALQACKLDVQWELECLPVIVPKRKWYSMLREKFPPQMEILSSSEITSGVRELSEGVLKYTTSCEPVEFLDRLLFISVSPSTMECGYPRCNRYGVGEMSNMDMKNLRFSMQMTQEIKQLVPTPAEIAKAKAKVPMTKRERREAENPWVWKT